MNSCEVRNFILDIGLNTNKITKPWSYNFKAFIVIFSLGLWVGNSQNILNKEIKADGIDTISIDGNQIFNISVETTKADYISIASKLDGEYQNAYQIAVKYEDNELILGLEFMSFEDVPDDKRNAHKVIAATLVLKVPENLNLNISSDVGSVDLKGDFNMLLIKLLQGHCLVNGMSKITFINTIDGKISVVTNSANVNAISKNGTVVIEDFEDLVSQWNLESINGDITVVKKE